MIRRVIGLASAPARYYWTDIPCKVYLDDSPDIEEHHHHEHPHPSEETVSGIKIKAWDELQAVLKSLPKRNYNPVLEELIQRSKKNLV